MPRPKQNRKISNPPLMQGFKPHGIPRNMLSSVSLLYDEYEAVRLLDYEGLNQDQAAARMNVSRPTLTRIYEQGRQFGKRLQFGRWQSIDHSIATAHIMQNKLKGLFKGISAEQLKDKLKNKEPMLLLDV